MKSLLSVLFAFSFVGCVNDDHDHSGHDHPEGEAHKESASVPANDPSSIEKGNAAVSEDSRTVEVACASCIYKMSGVSDCKLAAKIDGKAVLVTGVSLDAHESGLCSGAKQASVKGELRGGKFVAKEVKIQ